MATAFDQFVIVLKSELTQGEREKGVAYAVNQPFAKGQQLDFPGVTMHMPWEGFLAFVDRDPMANWGHPARYLLISYAGEIQSFETRLPPFHPGGNLIWHVVYKAPSVPDSGVAGPR
jgi:hypothetical protein